MSDKEKPRFVSARAVHSMQTPAYIAFQWHDAEGRRHTQPLNSFDDDEEAIRLAAKLNAALEDGYK